MRPKVLKPIRKVQVVYYLTRNGQLEHPYYMEVTHLLNQPLCLRDVMERLTALRGKGMPSLYAWSCKRSCKNSYVWNDLADNDIIPQSDETKDNLNVAERIEQLQISNRVDYSQEPSLSLHTKQKSPTSTLTGHRAPAYGEQDFDEEKEDEYLLDEEKTCYTSSITPHSRCSIGVSTDELDDQQEPHKTVSESAQQHS
ncbi:Cellulase protein isoform 1 [Hibiscus syriacus]|uniref:Cellulase protein isoform 1 n=1 Tax=Hibiscus syriacus TaxID=106335 RepID=A0A6A3AD73_HIBSY|nr:Cellulase protein isoform 1 [Hibiscus syriacus]